ncbi:hypothetical protein BJX99DRAFT_203215 [Aspergillus californicus]
MTFLPVIHHRHIAPTGLMQMVGTGSTLRERIAFLETALRTRTVIRASLVLSVPAAIWRAGEVSKRCFWGYVVPYIEPLAQAEMAAEAVSLRRRARRSGLCFSDLDTVLELSVLVVATFLLISSVLYTVPDINKAR